MMSLFLLRAVLRAGKESRLQRIPLNQRHVDSDCTQVKPGIEDQAIMLFESLRSVIGYCAKQLTDLLEWFKL